METASTQKETSECGVSGGFLMQQHQDGRSGSLQKRSMQGTPATVLPAMEP